MTSRQERLSGLRSVEEMREVCDLVSELCQTCRERGSKYTKLLLEILQTETEGMPEQQQILNAVDQLLAVLRNPKAS